jgi:hypothetical protein
MRTVYITAAAICMFGGILTLLRLVSSKAKLEILDKDSEIVS